MKLNKKEDIKRAGIYFFYDKDGIVDDYVFYFLEKVKDFFTHLLFVSNGDIENGAHSRLKSLCDDILIRENKGFDVWAYKEGMQRLGDKLDSFDELVMFNSTIMGPVYDFKDVFDEMNGEDVDFWGLTVYHKVDYDPFGTIKYGYIPKHIQSHFIAVRNSMLTSEEFKKYWADMPEINSYNEAVGCHEAIFTKTFGDKGYKWKSYVNTEDMEKHSFHPIIMAPVEIIKNRKCPIFKRRSFFHNYDELLNQSTAHQSMELMDYLKNHTDYDVDMIWKNIIRTQNMADIRRNLHLDYILPSDKPVEGCNTNKKVALIMHIYFEDLIDYCYNYASSMPSNAHIYITTNTPEKKKLIEERFKNIDAKKVEVILIKNRGRDVSALLTGAKDFVMDYDYVCFAHDKKVGQLDLGIKGESFSYHCFENILHNKAFVENIIDTFEKNPFLGLLTPMPPYHSDYYPTVSFEWGYNYEVTVELAGKLGLKVDMSRDKEPIAPLGTMFWFRPKAMKTLFDKDWDYEDFPPEPNKPDGTLLHAIERIYPFVVQHEGYYCGWLLCDKYAKVALDNFYFMLSRVNEIAFKIYGLNSHYGLVNTMIYQYNLGNSLSGKAGSYIIKRAIKEKLRPIIPDRLWKFCAKVYRRIRSIFRRKK